MAYYKGVLRRTDKTKPGKYYPTAVTVGRVTTDELCDEIAEISTVSHADVVAVLKGLNRTIGGHLSPCMDFSAGCVGGYSSGTNTIP